MSPSAIEPSEPGLDISAMIDVSFLLLIYFIATSTLMPEESDLDLTLPVKETGQLSEFIPDQITVSIDGAGNVLANDEIMDLNDGTRELPRLVDMLTLYRQSSALLDTEPLVTIKASDSANAQRLVDVLNVLAHQGIEITNVTMSGFRKS